MGSTLTVAALMKAEVISLHEDATVEQLRERMHEAEIRHMPIVDARQRLVGIVSQRDLHRAPTGSARVQDILVRDVATVRPDTPAATAVALLVERRIGALPVVDEHKTLLGIITATDFLLVAQEALAGYDPARRAQA